ncbi:MAG: SLBB domain-containing protein [bacterium]
MQNEKSEIQNPKSRVTVCLLFLLVFGVKAQAQQGEGFLDQELIPAGVGAGEATVLPFGHQLLETGQVQEGDYLLEGAALTPPDYRLGPGDILNINIWGKLNTSYRLQVTPEGKIFIPGVGELFIQNLTIGQTQEMVWKQVGKYYKDIEVNVLLTGLRPIRVFVLGRVRQPDIYRFSPLDHVSTAIKKAGGLEPSGSIRRIQLRRNPAPRAQNPERNLPSEIEVDLYRFFIRGELAQNPLLEADDVIYVPPAGPTVSIEGKVKRPGQYEIKDEEGFEDLLIMAGGFHPEAYVPKVLIKRITPAKKSSAFWIDPTDLKPGFKLENGDQITIYSYDQQVEDTVLLKGQVAKPGIYTLSRGETLRGVILRAGGITSAATREEVKIERKGEVLSVNLYDLMIEKDPEADLELLNGDVITLPAAPNTVTVVGEVQTGGTFPYEPARTVSYYLGLAGGFSERANERRIEITRRDGSTRKVKRETVVEAGETIVVDRLEIKGWRDWLSVLVQGFTLVFMVDSIAK